MNRRKKKLETTDGKERRKTSRFYWLGGSADGNEKGTTSGRLTRQILIGNL